MSPMPSRGTGSAWSRIRIRSTAIWSCFLRCRLSVVPTARRFNAKVWEAAVTAHDAWEGRLEELAPAAALGSRPIDFGNERCNVGFVSEQNTDLRGVHRKACLPDQEGLWGARG